jgi:DNA (cytosine-5)-methyltransferase 1
MTLRVCSLFSGCGGLDYGFHHNTRFEHVFANDFNKRACDTYQMNFNFPITHGDITKIKDEDVPECDIVIGGFPCQGFSTQNYKRKLEDPRNVLYLQIVRILKAKQPKYFLLENVRGILSIDKSRDAFNRILADLTACGYNVQWRLYNLKKHNIPQDRNRVIIIGVRNNVKWTPNMDSIPITTPIPTLRNAIGDLPIEYDESRQHFGTALATLDTGHFQNKTPSWDKPCWTLTKGAMFNHPSMRRRLTAREFARIHTYPDNFTFVGNSVYGILQLIANSVPPRFSEYLAQLFLKAP